MIEAPVGKLSAGVAETLRCPTCHGALQRHSTPSTEALVCTQSACAREYPIVDGIPVLINESRSLFSVADFLGSKATTFIPAGRLATLAERLLPTISCNIGTEGNYEAFASVLLAQTSRPRVLVVGGSIIGNGMKPLVANQNIELVETDVSLGTRTKVICDGHDLPFADQSFDGVIAQAVLEHVLDPHRCVDEIHRVLKAGGAVYAETPFMQQVHMGKYDFTRFTDLGHRRLFRGFQEVRSGIACGPAMALAWSIEYFLLSFTRRRVTRMAARGAARLATFWLKYLDYYLVKQPGAYDAASGFYFLGTKTSTLLTDYDLIERYRGAIR